MSLSAKNRFETILRKMRKKDWNGIALETIPYINHIKESLGHIALKKCRE
jgi:hypothetical protein